MEIKPKWMGFIGLCTAVVLQAVILWLIALHVDAGPVVYSLMAIHNAYNALQAVEAYKMYENH